MSALTNCVNDRLAENLPNLCPRKGRKRFFQPSQEEKAAFELARLDSKLKRKDNKLKRMQKMEQATVRDKKALLEQKSCFVKGLQSNRETKDLFEPGLTKNLLM